MSQDREKRIQQRAYEIWESEGRPPGREQEHWLRAERELEPERRSDADLQRPAATIKSPEPVRPPEQNASQAEEAVEAIEAVSGRRQKG